MSQQTTNIRERNTAMNQRKTRLALAAGALVVLTAAGVAAAQAAPSGAADRSTTSSPAVDRGSPAVEQQSGIVVEASGSAAGITASVTLYENSEHGNSVQVVLGEDLIGYAEPASALVVDGTVEQSVLVDGTPATVTGTLTGSGRPEKLVEPMQDAGEQIVTRGTHTALVGDLTLTYDGVTVPLHLDNAFAYDLEVRRVALYGR
jgi:hypothetical protein